MRFILVCLRQKGSFVRMRREVVRMRLRLVLTENEEVD